MLGFEKAIVNIDQAKNISSSFPIAFGRCMEQRPLSNNQFELPLVPAIVCAAFSIELGFKALILSAGGQASGHELSKLFKKLPTTTQDFIVRDVGIKPDAFAASLDLVSNAFVDWRYIYEKSSTQIDCAFLGNLARATQSAVAVSKAET